MHLSMASIVMARVVGLQLHYVLIRSTGPREQKVPSAMLSDVE
jgi:hypothetical protein